MTDDEQPYDAEAVRNMVIPHRTRLDRRKATYGTYRFNGRAKDRLSWLQTGARVEYAIEERDGRQLDVVARAEDKVTPVFPRSDRVVLEARVSIAGSPAGEVMIHTTNDGELAHVAVLYAAGLAMSWDWVTRIALSVPASIATRVAVIGNRRGLVREGRVERENGARILRFRVVSPQETAKR